LPSSDVSKEEGDDERSLVVLLELPYGISESESKILVFKLEVVSE
jgi:hypothetical protein